MPPKNSLGFLTVIITLAAALLSGGIVYALQSRHDISTQQNLQDQIDSLKILVSITPTPLVTPITTVTPNTETQAPCESKDVAVTFTAAKGGNAAGTGYYNIVVTNTSGQKCTIIGGPTLLALNASGVQVGKAIPSLTTVKQIMLKPSVKAYSLVGFANPGNFNSGTCKPIKDLMIFLAGQTNGLTLTNIDHYSSYTTVYCQEPSVGAFSLTEQ